MLTKKLQEAAGNAGGEAVYVEDVFSTYLYTGNGSTQTIVNGIDLAGEGGLVWIKNRQQTDNHRLSDTERGANLMLASNSAGAEVSNATQITGFTSSGFTIGSGVVVNTSGENYVSWTFRKQQKFFDVVTYTGNGTAGRTVAHNLGSVPGCIIIKRRNLDETNWQVYHRANTGSPETDYLSLNLTDATIDSDTRWNDTAPTDSVFTLGSGPTVNASGATYVAYLFAHNAGGFGLSGTDNVISCGSYTGNGSTTGPVVTLGYEPQWLMIKNTSAGTYENWVLLDVMRGLPVNGAGQRLYANVANSEASSNPYVNVLATGFQPASASSQINTSGNTYIYIAIRRGPMKVPESGTEVYQPLINQPLSGGVWNHNILTDFSFYHWQNGTQNWGVQDRLRGDPDLSFNSTAAESALIGGNKWDVMTGYINPNPGAGAYSSWAFRRAPGFMDVVCYTGTGVARTVNHNLGVVPELMIVKNRTNNIFDNWYTFYDYGVTAYKNLFLNLANASSTVPYGSGLPLSGAPTNSIINVGSSPLNNASSIPYVTYIFATLAGVSKVGSYTGTGTTQQINCGFSSGARFVLIKRTDSTGDWYVWDTARGIVAGNDPYILLNSGATSVTGTDYIDPYAAGFEISSTAPAAINASGGTFIYLAIA